jgi:hypothetical protein
MSNALKEKLTHKLEKQATLEHPVSPNTFTALTAQLSVEEPKDNLIVLNNKQEHTSALQVVPEFVITMNDAKERIRMLQEFVREMMKEGIDYGVVPGCNKPSLLKSGAEKLCDIFGFSKQLEVTNRVEDWEKGFFHYEIKAILISKRTGIVEAEGIACCNNREKKFKSQDAYSIVNTIVKMAKKRALVDAVLSATRSSGIFTQDVEDFICDHSPVIKVATPVVQSYVSSSSVARKEQLRSIFLLVEQKSIPIDKMKALLQNRYRVLESKSLTEPQADDLIALLEAYNAI